MAASKYEVLLSDLDWFLGSMLDGTIIAPIAVPALGSCKMGMSSSARPRRKLSVHG